MGGDARHVFDPRGGSIGREPENDWVLPDENLIVSSQHALVGFRDGAYFLTDTSTNGVFLNDSDAPVGYDKSVRLRAGDTLAIGEYEIRAEIESADYGSAGLLDGGRPGFDNEAARESAWSGPEQSEPLPLGLGEEGGSPGGAGAPIPEDWDQGGAGFDQPASHPDHSPVINDAFESPAVHQEQIPADWDKIEETTDLRPSPDSPPPPPAPEPAAGFPPPPPPEPPAPPQPVTPVQPTAEPPPVVGGATGEGIAAFLQGAGLDPAKAPVDNPRLSLDYIGRRYREMVQGVMDILVARSTLKNEFRMPHTIIRATENNPLKFSMGVDDALEYLLYKEGSGFLPADEAFREAFQDIKDHQFATVAGMRAAFESLFNLFSPERLQTKFKSGGKWSGLLALNRNAACWESYEQWYAALAQDKDDQFQQLFAKEFGRAYEEQIARLSAARRKRRP
jgi:type VI secretion system protein